jgi:2-C-methyl-D-erythritol 4-phosphate cytidylyltransferase
MAAQTPQVFRSAELRAAYERAEVDGFDGYDTAEVVSRYSNLKIAAVPGDPANIKITYPEDLREVREILEGRQSRS